MTWQTNEAKVLNLLYIQQTRLYFGKERRPKREFLILYYIINSFKLNSNRCKTENIYFDMEQIL